MQFNLLRQALRAAALLLLALGSAVAAQAQTCPTDLAAYKAYLPLTLVASASSNHPVAAATTPTPTPPASAASPPTGPKILASRGDEVSFTIAGRKDTVPAVFELLKCLNAKGTAPTLVLNGMALGSGATLQNPLDWMQGKVTFLLTLPTTARPDERPQADQLADAFWASVYRTAGWAHQAPQRVALELEGLGVVAQSPASSDPNLQLWGSSRCRYWLALATAACVGALFLWALATNQVFRDKAPAWIEKAQSLGELYKSPTHWKIWLDGQAADLALSVADFQTQAVQSFKKIKWESAVPSERDAQLAITGAWLSDKKAPETSYSLSRVQLGAWLLVVLLGGLLMWMFQGQLPTIPQVYLALLGISGGTKLLSGAIDNAREHPIGTVHRSFLEDLCAGTNGGGVHRYQALLANVVLLATVAFDIARTLSFPPLNDSWLVLITGSAGVYLAVKKTSEDPPARIP
jgi:hypothetical protein